MHAAAAARAGANGASSSPELLQMPSPAPSPCRPCGLKSPVPHFSAPPTQLAQSSALQETSLSKGLCPQTPASGPTLLAHSALLQAGRSEPQNGTHRTGMTRPLADKQGKACTCGHREKAGSWGPLLWHCQLGCQRQCQHPQKHWLQSWVLPANNLGKPWNTAQVLGCTHVKDPDETPDSGPSTVA